MIWVEFTYKTNWYILFQHMLMHLILISVNNSNIIILKARERFSLNQETGSESNQKHNQKRYLSWFLKYLHISVLILFFDDW
jgi:hypothetical protein